ncbi:MAG: endolytic transglycosylase MltG [Armatimonadetes bacterium]|nr:endolytic transglycosylase MltG [Armatimonadota bacterium]
MSRRGKGCGKSCGCASLALAALIGAGAWFAIGLTPTPVGKERYVKFASSTRLHDALVRLEGEGIVKNAMATEAVARVTGRPAEVKSGTYRLKPGLTTDGLFQALSKPVVLRVRTPEGWWIARTAKRLEDSGVCSAEEYRLAAADTSLAQEAGLTVDGSLEGFLFPDTYDFSPATPAVEVVKTQLRTFKRKVGEGDLRRTVTIASLVELEAALDAERSKIAGVIENRLKKNMTLDLDASVLYALQEWRQLPPGFVRTVRSPYNTYLHKGLPPGPIGSPSVKSILAAKRPDTHGYLYYVARPDRSHLFAKTYEEHRENIKKARKEWAAKGRR